MILWDMQELLYGIIFAVIVGTSADEPFQGLFKQGAACFPVKKFQECDTKLENVFKAKTPVASLNVPTTLVFLFTPSSPDEAEPLHSCGGKLPKGSTYDPECNTEVFIHGWLDGVCRSAWMREMKEQLYIRQKCKNYQKKDPTNPRNCFNVILVDWTWGNTPDYAEASQNCKVTGEQVAFVIRNIIIQKNITGVKFHVTGNGFGNIASSFVGKNVKNLRRVTTLDNPLAPYKYAPPTERLTYTDALIVDNIHTDAGDCSAIFIGDDRNLGDADFYPNGGSFQASCYPYFFISLLKGDILYALASLDPRLCSHVQSLQYYKTSINPKGCQFVGVAAKSYDEFKNRKEPIRKEETAVMGMDYELYHFYNGSERRKYYLDTALLCPYYDGDNVKNLDFPFGTSCTCS